MSNRKITHIITGLENGGAEAVLFLLCTSDDKHEHTVISMMNEGKYGALLREAGVAVYCLGMPRGRLNIGGLVRLWKLLRAEKPAIVQTWMYHANLIGGLVARLAGVKAITWGIHHANFDPAHNSRVTLLIIKLCALLSNWIPTKIVSCSVKATELHQALGYRPDIFINIPNGYALEKLKPDARARCAVREELAIASDAFVFGMVARFDPLKDHQNLIRALGQINRTGQRFLCLMVGVGMDDGNSLLVAEIAAAGISEQVRLLGPRNDIPAVMNALDVHVLSSMGEAFPNVLAEAMACGTPCVTTDVGDAALIIGGHGWLVSARNPMALAEGILGAKAVFDNDRQAWQAMQSACRAHTMTNFELSQMCDRYKNTWAICLQASK